MIYYNQYSYEKIPYPAQGYEKATLKTSGCGVCCASMVLANLNVATVKPPEMAQISIKCGARVTGGTDMYKLLAKLAEMYPITWYETAIGDKALSELRYNGAMVICNTKGNVGSYVGLFSDGGHYVVAAEASTIYVSVLDSGLYAGKYDKPSRKSRATVSGQTVYVRPEHLIQDCKRFFVVKRKKENKTMTVEEAKSILKTKAGLSDKTIEFLYNYRYGDDLLKKLAEAMK